MGASSSCSLINVAISLKLRASRGNALVSKVISSSAALTSSGLIKSFNLTASITNRLTSLGSAPNQFNNFLNLKLNGRPG